MLSGMTRGEFEEVVSRALEDLPREIQEAMENVAVVVRNWPTRQQLHGNDVRSRYHLLGLYEGVPQTERDTGYGMVLPDRITIFQRPLERFYPNPEELAKEIRNTVVHEVAHHFGISDERLHEMGL